MSVVTNKLRSGKESSVVVGSGYLYACLADDIADPFNISAAEREAMEEIGYIESNAVLKANANSIDVTTANYGKIGKLYSDKDVSFVTGILSWNMENVAKYLTGSDVEKTESGTRFYYGVKDQAPKVCLIIVSEDETLGNRISLIMPKAQFQGELEMDFNADNPVSFNYAFDLMSSVRTDERGKQKPVYFYTVEEDTTTGNGG